MTPQELKKLVGKDKVIQKAFKVLDRFYWTPQQITTYDKIEKSQMDYRASIEDAKEEGREETLAILKNLGVSPEILEKAQKESEKKRQ